MNSQYTQTTLTCNFIGGTFAIIFDIFFLISFQQNKKRRKPDYILICLATLTLINLSRVILYFCIYALGSLANYSESYCIIMVFLYTVFRLTQHLYCAVLAYALCYKITTKKLGSENTPGEKYIFYVVIGVTIALAISISIYNRINNLSSGFGCSSLIFDQITMVVFANVILFDTTVLGIIMYSVKILKRAENVISLPFYFCLFISFDYIRLPYFICTLMAEVTSISFHSGANLVGWGIVSFLNMAAGGVTSMIFSYNLGYFKFFYISC